MRIVETVVAVPAIVMAMAIIAGLGVGLTKAMLAVGIVYSMVITRLTRAEVFAARGTLRRRRDCGRSIKYPGDVPPRPRTSRPP